MVRSSYAGLITPSEVLAQIMKQLTVPITVNVTPPAVTVNISPPAASIRPGEPGNESAFRETFDAVGGADLLGSPMGYVETFHDGYMQRFDGGPTGIERVLCAPGGHPVVAMDRAVWDQLQRSVDITAELSASGFRSRGARTDRTLAPTGPRSSWSAAPGDASAMMSVGAVLFGAPTARWRGGPTWCSTTKPAGQAAGASLHTWRR